MSVGFINNFGTNSYAQANRNAKAGKTSWPDALMFYDSLQTGESVNRNTDPAGDILFQATSKRTTGHASIWEMYRTPEVSIQNVKPSYQTCETKNYRIVPDNEAECFDIYNEKGERLGAFEYSDIKIRQDSVTGKQFLISEHGTMSYDALVMDDELKEALQSVMGVETLETESLQGFTVKTHSGTGIQYLVRHGEEGRGGKVLLQDEEDQRKYEELAQTYLNRYSNLIDNMTEAYIWADLEIKGLAQHTKNGIISMGFDGMSYNDNVNYRNNWSVLFSGDTYTAVYEWLQNNRENMEEMQEFAAWQSIFRKIGSQYERILSDEEEKSFRK